MPTRPQYPPREPRCSPHAPSPARSDMPPIVPLRPCGAASRLSRSQTPPSPVVVSQPLLGKLLGASSRRLPIVSYDYLLAPRHYLLNRNYMPARTPPHLGRLRPARRVSASDTACPEPSSCHRNRRGACRQVRPVAGLALRSLLHPGSLPPLREVVEQLVRLSPVYSIPFVLILLVCLRNHSSRVQRVGPRPIDDYHSRHFVPNRFAQVLPSRCGVASLL